MMQGQWQAAALHRVVVALQQVLPAASDNNRSNDGALLITFVESKTTISFFKWQSIGGDGQQRQVAFAERWCRIDDKRRVVAAIAVQRATVSGEAVVEALQRLLLCNGIRRSSGSSIAASCYHAPSDGIRSDAALLTSLINWKQQL